MLVLGFLLPYLYTDWHIRREQQTRGNTSKSFNSETIICLQQTFQNLCVYEVSLILLNKKKKCDQYDSMVANVPNYHGDKSPKIKILILVIQHALIHV